jgi:type VI protein secretion system component VasK
LKSNRFNYFLGALLIGALIYSIYSSSKVSRLNSELEQCQQKHEEALVDVLEAFKRLEAKEGELQKLLEEVEQQKKHAEERLEELQRGKNRK